MARPTLPTKMARCAVSALIAAVEIYNKPNVEYREQTFAMLVVNAWEILLKARIVQKQGGKIESIYRRKARLRHYIRGEITKEPLTIQLGQALSQAGIPQEVKNNITGLTLVRNQAAHLGILSPDLRQSVLQYGTASIQNFIKMVDEWFKEPVNVPYLMPIGFVGNIQIEKGRVAIRQQQLIRRLSEIASEYPNYNSPYSVVLTMEVNLNPKFSGGGNIGPTNDPNAPRIQMTDDQVFSRYPTTYKSLTKECSNRYCDFKQGERFNELMRMIKNDPNCAYERKLDPSQERSSTKTFYNLEAVFAKLDDEYTKSA